MVCWSPRHPCQNAANGASAIDALGEKYWQREVQYDYALRAQLGKPIETIRAVTYANVDEDAQFGQSILDGLAQVDEKTLDHAHWLTYRTLQYLATNDVATRKYYWLRQQATPYAGGLQISGIATVLGNVTFATADDATRYEALLKQYAAFVRSLQDLLTGQHERGIILPNVESDAMAAIYTGYAQPAQSDALVPADTRLQALSPGDRTALQAAAKAIVTSDVVPAFQSLAAYISGPYRTGAPSGVGLAQYPGGPDYYRYLVVENTTLTITPEKLHAMGLDAVAQLNEKLDGIRREVGFHGNLAAFKHFLATDPQFFVKTTQQFGDRLEMYVKRAAAAAPNYFVHLPNNAVRRRHASEGTCGRANLRLLQLADARPSKRPLSLQRLASGDHVSARSRRAHLPRTASRAPLPDRAAAGRYRAAQRAPLRLHRDRLSRRLGRVRFAALLGYGRLHHPLR